MTIKAHMHCAVAGHFWLTAVNSITGERRQIADFRNLILDAGLDRIATGAILNACQLGSGSTAPAASQTSLVSLLASTTTIQLLTTGVSASAPWYRFYRRVFRFAPQGVDRNYSEVGVGWATSGSLFSRALIKDSGGTPITITILAAEYLDVTYEYRVYQNSDDVTLTLSDGTTSHDIICRPAAINTAANAGTLNSGSGLTISNASPFPNNTIRISNAAITAATSYPSSGDNPASIFAPYGSYVNGSYERYFRINAGLNDGNVSGINSIFIGTTLGGWQFGFTPAISKTSEDTLIVDLKITWGRYAP